MDDFEAFPLRYLCSQSTLQAQWRTLGCTAVCEHHYSPQLCDFKTLGETKQQQKLDMPENKTQCPWASDKWHTPFLLSQTWGRGGELWWPQLMLSLALRPLSCISCKQGTVPPQRWPGNELARADVQLHHTQRLAVPEGTMGQPIIHNVLLKSALPFRDSFENIIYIICQPPQSFYFQ